jgi:hypothetical protein
MSPMALTHFAEEAIEKVKEWQAMIVEWVSKKDNPHRSSRYHQLL